MRVRRMLGLVFVLALVVAACGDDDASTTSAAAGLTQTEGVLTVGSDIPYPPFEDFDGDTVVGFDADLITEIADRLGLEVEWIDTDFDTIFTQLATGRFDVVISATTITPERAAQVAFTDPYYKSQQAFTVNTTLTPAIASTDDLAAGDSVAVQTGTTGADWATANLAPRGIEVREFAGIGDAYNAVEAGQVTGVVSDEPSAVAEIANREGIAIVQVIDTNENYGIAVDPARTALLDAINDAFADMLADGTYQEIYDTWFEAPAGSVLYEAPVAAPVGTAENPLLLVFAPTVAVADIRDGGEQVRDLLEATLGLEVEVVIPPSYAATAGALCDATDAAIGFVPAEVYVVASRQCGIVPALKSLRFGSTEYWTEVIVARDAPIDSLADLDGLTWAYPEADSISGYLIPLGMFALAGIEPGATVDAGGHTAAVRAVYNGEADFATVRFAPTIDLEGETVWDGTAAGADIPADLVASCAPDTAGDLSCGDLRPRDARRGLRDEAPDVIQRVRILDLSPAIPNDLVVIGGAMPADLRDAVTAALLDYAQNDPEGFTSAFESLVWDSLVETGVGDFAGLAALLDAIDFGIDDL